MTGWPLEVWFTGHYLSPLDRVHHILDTQNCSDLPDDAGFQVELAYDPSIPVALRGRGGAVAGWCVLVRGADARNEYNSATIILVGVGWVGGG